MTVPLAWRQLNIIFIDLALLRLPKGTCAINFRVKHQHVEAYWVPADLRLGRGGSARPRRREGPARGGGGFGGLAPGGSLGLRTHSNRVDFPKHVEEKVTHSQCHSSIPRKPCSKRGDQENQSTVGTSFEARHVCSLIPAGCAPSSGDLMALEFFDRRTDSRLVFQGCTNCIGVFCIGVPFGFVWLKIPLVWMGFLPFTRAIHFSKRPPMVFWGALERTSSPARSIWGQ